MNMKQNPYISQALENLKIEALNPMQEASRGYHALMT